MSGHKKEYLVGVNYFSGWWRLQPNKYTTSDQKDWRMDYPERTALLGCYNDQETMDAEIIAASDYGVGFFWMLWYVEKPERHPHGERLNNGLRQFISSKESHRMKFAIEFCNHEPFLIKDDGLWEESCREWVQLMKHESYLKVGNKAVFKVHGFRQFVEENKGNVDFAMSRLEKLRAIAREEGIGELLIGSGIMALDSPKETEMPFINLFEFFGTYMDIPVLPILSQPYPYEKLLELAEKAWEEQPQKCPITYIPYLPAGWKPDPWGDPRPPFELPDSRQWVSALMEIKAAMDKSLGLRLQDGTVEGQKIFTIYAWNEFAEGGIVAPTIGDGLMKLKGIQKVFGK